MIEGRSIWLWISSFIVFLFCGERELHMVDYAVLYLAGAFDYF